MMQTHSQAGAGVAVDSGDMVKIEIEHLTAEMVLELNVQLRPADLTAHLVGSNVTWAADGVRVTMPTSLLEAIREMLARVIIQQNAGPSPSGGAETS
jgi:hypothetical protein